MWPSRPEERFIEVVMWRDELGREGEAGGGREGEGGRVW